MNINLLITTPLAYTFSRTQPTDANGVTIPYTSAEQAMADGIASIKGEWIDASRTATTKLFCVISQGADLPSIQGLITATGAPLTILHAQDAQQSMIVDALGEPVLDANGDTQMQTVVHKQAVNTDLLPFMPDVVTTNNAMPPVELSRTAATSVTLPAWAGHAAWSL
ncbi:MAG: hypothetical protein R8M45_03630 [Ghiorsea sp.]